MLRIAIFACLATAFSGACFAQGKKVNSTKLGFNIKSPTLGGTQIWNDELVFRGWRIQRNHLTDHCRLLDGDDRRHAWGTFEGCYGKLQESKVKYKLKPVKGKLVIAIHGLLRSRGSMKAMCDYLEKEGDYTAIGVSYASTRGSLEKHAKGLASIMRHLDKEITEINFVAHSLGNLVIRRYLDDCHKGRNGLRPDPRIRRIVMLAPPNNGARLAEMFKNNKIVEMIWGESAMQLAKNWDNVKKQLATPRCQFAIVAGGGKNESSGRNVLLKGNDDLVVSVEETKLKGAHDFLVVPVIHGLIMKDAKVKQATLRFFEKGHLLSESQRSPLQ